MDLNVIIIIVTLFVSVYFDLPLSDVKRVTSVVVSIFLSFKSD